MRSEVSQERIMETQNSDMDEEEMAHIQTDRIRGQALAILRGLAARSVIVQAVRNASEGRASTSSPFLSHSDS